MAKKVPRDAGDHAATLVVAVALLCCPSAVCTSFCIKQRLTRAKNILIKNLDSLVLRATNTTSKQPTLEER